MPPTHLRSTKVKMSPAIQRPRCAGDTAVSIIVFNVSILVLNLSAKAGEIVDQRDEPLAAAILGQQRGCSRLSAGCTRAGVDPRDCAFGTLPCLEQFVIGHNPSGRLFVVHKRQCIELKLPGCRGHFPLGGERSPMGRNHTRTYPLEFRLKILELIVSRGVVYEP